LGRRREQRQRSESHVTLAAAVERDQSALAALPIGFVFRFDQLFTGSAGRRRWSNRWRTEQTVRSERIKDALVTRVRRTSRLVVLLFEQCGSRMRPVQLHRRSGRSRRIEETQIEVGRGVEAHFGRHFTRFGRHGAERAQRLVDLEHVHFSSSQILCLKVSTKKN